MKKSFYLLILFGLAIGCAARIVNIPLDIKPALRSGYGYTAEDPIRIGLTKDYFRTNIGFCYSYMENLRTPGQLPFRIIGRVSVKDPKNKIEGLTGFLGMPLRNPNPRGGILDRYTLVSEQDTDTIQLYFDIYHKDTLLIPIGLNYVQPSQ
jgi:hypothetical protein